MALKIQAKHKNHYFASHNNDVFDYRAYKQGRQKNDTPVFDDIGLFTEQSSDEQGQKPMKINPPTDSNSQVPSDEPVADGFPEVSEPPEETPTPNPVLRMQHIRRRD